MKKYLAGLISVLLINNSLKAAVFTIENYTGKDIRVELRLNKSSGSKTKRASIINGHHYRFDTGVYGIVRGGITWELNGDSYYLENVSIDNPLMIGGVIRLFKTGTYEFKFSDGSSGFGKSRKVMD